MTKHNTIAFLSLLLCALPAAAQLEDTRRDADPRIEGWIEELASPDLEVRERASQELLDHGSAAIPALREAFEHSPNPEVRWSSRWLLRELKARELGHARAEPSARKPPAAPPQPRQRGTSRLPGLRPEHDLRGLDLHDEIARLRREMDELRRWVRGAREDLRDPSGGPGSPRSRPGSPWQGLEQRDPFRDLEELLGGAQRGGLDELMERLRQRNNGGLRPLAPGQLSEQRSSSMVFQQNPDGSVRLEITRKSPDGNDEQETYEAETMEELRRRHGKVLEEHGLQLPGFGLGRREGAPRPSPQLAPEPHSGDRLGVYVSTPTEEERQELGLEPGTGLIVQEVMEDSLAARLGLQRGDVVLTLDGKPTATVESVRTALSEIRPGWMVKARVLRPGEGEIDLEARRPERKGLRPLEWY